MTNPWKLLNIPPTKDKEAISKAWRKLASIHHPDHGGDEDTFKQIRTAYEQALKKCNTVVEVVRPSSTITVNLSLGCSQVLTPQYVSIEFDYQNKTVECSVLIPEWEVEWGRKKSLLVKTNQGITLMIHAELYDDDLIWTDQLIWTPALELAPVLESRTISLIWNHKDIKLSVDNYGHAVLLSQGYKTIEGDRLNITVQPKYIWPKIKC